LKNATARALAYSTIAILAVGALQLNPPLPPTGLPTLGGVEVRPLWTRNADTLGSGETLSALLARQGVIGSSAAQLLRAATSLDARRVRAGMPVVVAKLDSDSMPSEVVFELAIDRLLTLKRTDSGWVSHEERLPWTVDTLVVRGTIASSLYGAMDASALELLPPQARAELAGELADIYEYRVDMSRDLQVGDEFRVLFERASGPQGVVRIRTILAASMTLSGKQTEAIRFETTSATGKYFDQGGKAMRAGFLQAPLQFRRISSVFGTRKHPVLKTWRAHKGTDYAASSGTPVRTVGDGTVIYAGRRSGYGNVVEIRHRNGFVTRYAHLRAFAKGIRSGARVNIENTIGYVGMTGLATGPHLHFEVLVKGVQRNPSVALRGQGNADPIPAKERARFAMTLDAMRASLSRPDGLVRLASAVH
jgi:murein DD-endopeptidase MepM/ murein hydrolase activator NlpD